MTEAQGFVGLCRSSLRGKAQQREGLTVALALFPLRLLYLAINRLPPICHSHRCMKSWPTGSSYDVMPSLRSYTYFIALAVLQSLVEVTRARQMNPELVV